MNNMKAWLTWFTKIDFAPLDVPLQRRLQTLAVVAVLITQVGSYLITPIFVIYLILYTRLWWLCLLYVVWIMFIDKSYMTGERRSEWVRNWTWFKYVREYFPVSLVNVSETELDPTRNYIFCYCPHGLLCSGGILTLGTNALNVSDYFPNHTLYSTTLSFNFKIPFMREFILALGTLEASTKAIGNVLSRPDGGNAVFVAIGGASEAYYCKPGLNKIIFKKRKGIIKLALKHGSPLVPVYGFGETDLYSQIDIVEGTIMDWIRKQVKKYCGVALVVPVGRGIFQYSFGILPHRRPITVVVGEPLDVPKIEEPTEDQINEVHQKFERKIIDLFESQKKYYIKNFETAHLEIA